MRPLWTAWRGNCYHEVRPMIHRPILTLVTALCLTLLAALDLPGAEGEEARRAFIAGNYNQSIALCEAAVRNNEPGEIWRLLLAECYVTVGKYPEAQKTALDAKDRHATSVRMRWTVYEVLRQCGQPTLADPLLNEIIAVANASPNAYRDAGSLVAVGKAAILRGADPKQVLEKLFDQAKRREPENREAYLAAGNLALDKNDFELAAAQFREGLKRFANDPDFHFGLARAYAPSDAKEMSASLERTLELNPHHIPGLLLLADHLIDGEEYAEAGKNLDKIAAINPWRPEAWAYRAVIQRLQNDPAGQQESREKALRFWKTNPEVDFLIGQKLSRKYRFVEGAECQRRALRFDTAYLPAKIQLAQDLLRLGEEAEGWNQAEEVFQRDAYDVVAYNLTTLKDSLAQFQMVTNRDFVVRMSTNEAVIYGTRVLALLDRAKARLSEVYGVHIYAPVIVEIFPEGKDFAVRTFGMPSESGYLGVCFGRVITANSPGRPGSSPANWESMLWHEFTHVITLQMTGNKIPRWLSEGISVYEERQADPSWGQRLNPRLRETILDGGLKKIAHLSAAFMTAKNPFDLQFAYYQSSLVVEFLMQRFGRDGMKKILADLNRGVELNKALETHAASLSQLEKDFADYARDYAQQMGPKLDWTKPPGTDGKRPGMVDDILNKVRQESAVMRQGAAPDAMDEWIRQHPTNYWALKEQARKRIAAKEWTEAKAPLKTLLELIPSDTGPDNAYTAMALVCRQLHETEEEQAALVKLAAIDDTALEAYARLMDLAAGRKDWKMVLENTDRYLAVNPLVPPPYRSLALASEALDQTAPAIQAYRLLLRLDPPDPAEVHYRLARLLHQTGDAGAKRQVLEALEEAPRFRDAHRLLLQMNSRTNPPVEAVEAPTSPARAVPGSGKTTNEPTQALEAPSAR